MLFNSSLVELSAPSPLLSSTSELSTVSTKLPISGTLPTFPISDAASAALSTSSAIEHFVRSLQAELFSWRALSLPVVCHLSADPNLRLRSTGASELAFTHLRHSRFSLFSTP